ncbi:hypothetical protein Tco_0328705 [Tanacetum coccineum]
MPVQTRRQALARCLKCVCSRSQSLLSNRRNIKIGHMADSALNEAMRMNSSIQQTGICLEYSTNHLADDLKLSGIKNKTPRAWYDELSLPVAGCIVTQGKHTSGGIQLLGDKLITSCLAGIENESWDPVDACTTLPCPLGGQYAPASLVLKPKASNRALEQIPCNYPWDYLPSSVFVKRVPTDVIEMACEEYSQEVSWFLRCDLRVSIPLIIMTRSFLLSSPTLIPSGIVTFLLEEVDALPLSLMMI